MKVREQAKPKHDTREHLADRPLYNWTCFLRKKRVLKAYCTLPIQIKALSYDSLWTSLCYFKDVW